MDEPNNENNNHIKNFIQNFKTLWAENGDYLSFIYAGSNSVTSRITKTGQHGFQNKLDSAFIAIKRFFQGHFEDSHK
jgi:hypothetical protein